MSNINIHQTDINGMAVNPEMSWKTDYKYGIDGSPNPCSWCLGPFSIPFISEGMAQQREVPVTPKNTWTINGPLKN